MNWIDHHTESERHAAEAQLAAHRGETDRARELYALAAGAESKALSGLDQSKVRTLGVTALSAAALWYKAGRFEEAEALVHTWLGSRKLPPFATDRLREILEQIWSVQALEAAGVRFTGNEVLVSVGGGQIVRGGAPLDLILQKVEQVSAMFYRTAEMLLSVPHRKRGLPDPNIREACRPWLFQTAPGSYQFAVRVQKPSQGTLFPAVEVKVEEVSQQFLQIVRAAVEDPEQRLKEIVPDNQYRETFLKLARNLAPTGKLYSRVSIRSPTSPDTKPIILQKESREGIHCALKKQFPRKKDTEEAEPVQLRGVLRALHLDENWIEITMSVLEKPEHVKVRDAGDQVDDILGPMVNHDVIVDAVKTNKGEYRLRDIQAAE
jgi:hypothetical protein